jgi:hypothetical protein
MEEKRVGEDGSHSSLGGGLAQALKETNASFSSHIDWMLSLQQKHEEQSLEEFNTLANALAKIKGTPNDN